MTPPLEHDQVQFIARHRLITLTVGLVVTVLVLATALTLFYAGDIEQGDVLVRLVYVVGGSLGFTLVGSIILVQRPGHRIGRLMMVMGVSLALSFGGPFIIGALVPEAIRSGPIPESIIALVEAVGFLAIVLGAVLLVVWFPDGRTTSRLGAIAQALVVVLTIVPLAMLLDPTFGESEIGFVLLLIAYASALVDLLMRYRHADGVRRTQIRWVLASGSVTASLAGAVVPFSDQIDWLWQLWILSTILPPIAVGIAITRYHLYEIDRIIGRTISYGVVTAVLFGVFWSVNLLLQGVLNAAMRSDPFVVAGSTLLVAALFNPLRIHVQRVVDRRFNRARYDAEQTVAGLAGRLRDEVDVARLRQDILDVVDASVKPTHVHLWLRAQ